MKTTSILIATSLLLAAGVRAQTTPPTPRQFGTGELPELLEAYDLDGDGKLSIEERQAFERAMREQRHNLPGGLGRWDTDGDGKLSPEEIQAARETLAAKIREMRVKRFNELDVNDDGQLSALELKAIPGITDEMVARLIAHLDKNDNATISLEEFLAVLRPVIPPFPLPQPLPDPFPVMGIPCPPPLGRFDADHNGKLSLAEAQAAIAAIDTDNNGTVSPAEWDAYLKSMLIPPFPLPQPLPNPFPTTGIACPPALSQFDVDHNGRLSLAEAQAAIAAIDTDGNGTVSPAEWDTYRKSLMPPFPLPQPLPVPYPLTGLACPPPLASFDMDKNGRLSLTEAQSVIAALDTDGNGAVSPAEWDAYLKSHTIPPFPLPQPLPNPFPTTGLACPPPLARFDLDKNGRLSLAEAQAAIAAIDTDGNGTVSPAEWDTYLKSLMPPFPLPQPLPIPYPLSGLGCPPPLASFDVDKNGRLSLTEAQAVIAALDTDGNGAVSPAEWDAYLKSHTNP